MRHIQITLDCHSMDVAQLCQAYRDLDEQRMELDKQILTQAKDTETREQLWAEMEATMAQLHDIIDRLARTPAKRLAELRAKAAIVAALMRGTGPAVPDRKRAGLALSLTEDISGFSLGERDGN